MSELIVLFLAAAAAPLILAGFLLIAGVSLVLWFAEGVCLVLAAGVRRLLD